MKDLRTPAAIKKADRERQAREREGKKLERILAAAMKAASGSWQPIETCPFKALDSAWGVDGLIWISDGKEIALADVRARFGRPMHVVKEPQYAMTDHGIAMVGGEYAEIDAPEWWFEWEFRDQLRTTIRYGDTVQCEVEFLATHWMPAKPALPSA